MAKKYDLDPEEARNWRLAKMFDLRTFIGVLFVIFGVLVIIPGIIANPADIEKAAGINLALWVGGFMLLLGVIFLAWVLASPPPPVTKEEMAATKKALEEMGTSGGGLHHRGSAAGGRRFGAGSPGRGGMSEPQDQPAIVVGIDGSEDSKHALRWAAQQAELTNDPLQAITAWQYRSSFGTVWQIPATYGRSHDFSHVDFSEDAKKTLDGVIEEVLGERPPDIGDTASWSGDIRRRCSSRPLRHAGLLVVGASGHGGFVGMLLGSVTQHCVGHSACPVVVIRRPAQK